MIKLGRLASIAVLAAGGSGAAVEVAAAAVPPLAQTVLVSRTPAGSTPNGASANAVVSQDKRFGRVVAFESLASDIAPGAQPGVSNVYATFRAEPYGENGTPWAHGRTVLLSRGLGGGPANGASSRPAIDGSSRTPPTCVAFVSAASNLVAGDTNGVPDAFVADLATGRIARVSVSSSGAQANGPTTQVAVDARCTRVAFVSTASNLALRSTRRASWKSARTNAGRAGVRQVYVRAIGGTNLQDRALRGLTFLASASNRDRAGNGDSSDPVLSGRGRSLGFTSRATNLGGRPARGASQVYQRVLARRVGPRRRNARRVQDLRLSTHLVSAARGRAGNGDSADPAVTAAGDTFAYRTRATNLLPGNGRRIDQIAKTTIDARSRRHVWVTRSGAALGERPSREATISDGGEWVFYVTDARSLRPSGDANPASEILLDALPWVISTGFDERPLATGAQNPDTSPHGNYVVFDAGGLVLLRYLGPK